MSIGNCGTSFKKLTIRLREPFFRQTMGVKDHEWMKASEGNNLRFPVVSRGLRAGPESGSGWEPKEAGDSDESGQVESGGREGIPKGIDSPA